MSNINMSDVCAQDDGDFTTNLSSTHNKKSLNELYSRWLSLHLQIILHEQCTQCAPSVFLSFEGHHHWLLFTFVIIVVHRRLRHILIVIDNVIQLDNAAIAVAHRMRHWLVAVDCVLAYAAFYAKLEKSRFEILTIMLLDDGARCIFGEQNSISH